MTLLLLTALLVGANVVFALRELDIVLRSRVALGIAKPSATMPSLSIIVPARDEARQIERCVRSLLATQHPDFEVIAVDDQSTDGTGAVLEGIAAQDARLRVVVGAALPEGWVGKSWALAQGAKLARGAWLLFTDADTVHEPLAAASAQRWALDHRCAAVSLLSDQETVSAAERLFLPTILFVILIGVGPLDEINDPRKADVAIFNGQYVLTSREAYETIGGHAAVRAEIAEDLELARLFKRDGRFRIALVGANRLVRTRMYRSFIEIWRGFVKNFGIAARGHAAIAAGGVALLACVSPFSPILMLVLLARQMWLPVGVLMLAMAAVLSIAEYAMRTMRFRRGAGFALPLGLVLTLAIFVTSLVQIRSGRGVEWRGRRYGGVF